MHTNFKKYKYSNLLVEIVHNLTINEPNKIIEQKINGSQQTIIQRK